MARGRVSQLYDLPQASTALVTSRFGWAGLGNSKAIHLLQKRVGTKWGLTDYLFRWLELCFLKGEQGLQRKEEGC